MKMDNWTNTL